MSKPLALILLLLCLTGSLQAEEIGPAGIYHVVNTEGFSQKGDVRTALEKDLALGTVEISLRKDKTLLLVINSSELRLFPVDRGLASLEWNAEGTALLHSRDIQALLKTATPDAVPAWGADIVWPGQGQARLVLLPLGSNGLTGFLISKPGEKRIVRQMEFRKISGPANRPPPRPRGEKSGS